MQKQLYYLSPVLQARSRKKKSSSTNLTKDFSNTTVSSISKGFVSVVIVLGFTVFQLSGDVGSNLGLTYAIERVILVSFNLGDERF